MQIMTINCGSSSLKFRLFHVSRRSDMELPFDVLADGQIDRIGDNGSFQASLRGQRATRIATSGMDHAAATQTVFQWLDEAGFLPSLSAVGHRIVHGGDRFHLPSLVNEQVLEAIEAVSRLAPLHNLPALAAIRAARARIGNQLPMVAVFDTAFHHAMPRYASLYAIPFELSERHGIRRFGFHGLAHRYMAERYASITHQLGPPSARLITLQLGNGCSATAIDGQRSVDTSMGFTPLEGLMMGTRSGDLDPSLINYLAAREQVSTTEVEKWLNTQSGLLGLSGHSRDMRDLLRAESEGDQRAVLAVEMFCYRIRKYIGAYLAVLGGADAILFGGGIGENSPSIRARILDKLAWCGVSLDPQLNAHSINKEVRISSPQSTIHAYVIPVDEHTIVAQDTLALLPA